MGVGVSPPKPPPVAAVPPGAPSPAPLPARRSAAGAQGERQLRVAAATGECQPGGGEEESLLQFKFHGICSLLYSADFYMDS